MEMYDAITSLIGNVGFPIACCCVMFYQNSKLRETLAEISKAMNTMNERIKDVEDALKR